MEKSSRKFIDLYGRRFGRLTVLISTRNKHKQLCWICQCDCGTKIIISTSNLKTGHTKSCGCLRREMIIKRSTTHGVRHTLKYRIWTDAKCRAKKQDLPFNLSLNDIPDIPEFCPILNIPLKSNEGGITVVAGSPTLDRVIPKLGYIVGNIQIISHRANAIKRDGTAEEHMKIAEYIKLNSKEIKSDE